MAVLAQLTSFQAAFYRLTDTSADDDDLIEHDASSLEALNQFLQYGVNDAQEHLMRCGLSDRWVKQATAITTWTGTDAADGGRYKDLESDFFRLNGDFENSALREIDGQQWGRLIDSRDRFRMRGDRYYLLNEQLWLCRAASEPASVIYDYLFRLPTLDNTTDVDFPTEERPLIVAYAAVRAKADSWLPGGPEMEVKLTDNLTLLKQQAYSRTRRNRAQRRLRPKRTVGTHWFM